MRRMILTFVSLLFFVPRIALAQDALDLPGGTTTAVLGEAVELPVTAQFVSDVLGGEVRVEYDRSVLALTAIDWNLGYGDDPLLRCPPDSVALGARGCEGSPEFLAMGHLGGLPDGTVASLVFAVVAEGRTDVELVPVSPFSDLSGGVVAVTHDTAEVIVVPEPGLLAGLFAGGLLLSRLSGRPRSAMRGLAG